MEHDRPLVSIPRQESPALVPSRRPVPIGRVVAVFTLIVGAVTLAAGFAAGRATGAMTQRVPSDELAKQDGAAAPMPPSPPPAAAGAPAQSSVPPVPAASLVKDAETDRAAKELELRRRLMMPPIEAAQLERIPELLRLDTAARERFATVRAQYETNQTEARRLEARQLEVLLPAAFRYDTATSDYQPVHTPELLTALRARDRMLERVLAAEKLLDESIDRICPTETRPTWRTLRIQRAQEIFSHPARLPAAGVNLLELVPKVDLTPQELGVLEPFFERYARNLLDELRRRHDVLIGIEREDAETLVELGPEWRAGRTDSEALEVDRGLAQLEVAETLADTGLRTLNDKGIAQLKSELMPLSWRKVVEAYRRVVHPEIYEDERTYRVLTEEMLGLPALDQTTIGGIVESLGLLEERLRPLGQQAAELADGTIAADALAARDSAQARILLRSKLLSVLEKRRHAVRDAVKLLRAMVPSTEHRFAQKLDDQLQSLAALDRAGRFLKDGLDTRAAEVAVVEAIHESDVEAVRAGKRGVVPEPKTQPIGDPNGAADDPENDSSSAPPAGDTTKTPGSGRGSRRR